MKVEEGANGWKNLKSRCFWDDAYTSISITRLSPIEKLYLLHTRKGFIDFYIDMQIFVQSSRIYSGSQSVQNVSVHQQLSLGTEALYSTLPNGKSFKYPIDKSGSLRIDLT